MCNMDKELIEQLKTKLLEEKSRIENDIKASGGVKNKVKGKWRIKIPFFGSGRTSEEEANADQVEEYITELSVEKELEERLANINDALSKIEKGEYGVCENCKKEIDIERLKANPEARTCVKC